MAAVADVRGEGDDGFVGAKKSTGTERRPDSQQLVRQWAILKLLSDSPQAWGVKELAEQFGVSKPTIERDLATLEREFAVIDESVNKQKKTYRIDSKIRALETLTFGVTELLALFAAHRSLTGLAGTPIHDDLDQVINKVRGFLSPRHNGGLNAMAAVFMPHARESVNYEPHDEVIDDLVDAIAQKRRCRVKYFAPSKGTTRTHDARPLKLLWHNSSLYLLACLGEHDRISTLAVHRVQELEVTAETFKQPKLEEDVDDYMARAFRIFVNEDEHDVEVLFDKEIAWRVEERTFHPNETKERLADGRLRYRVRSSAQWEVIPWVQSFGPLAELVSPPGWRSALRANVEAMHAKYGTA